jgi:hypothetical protein
LLQNRNWRGLVLDRSDDNIEFIYKDNIMWRHDIAAKVAFITRDNINDLILGSELSGDIGLLSIDIDGNDYWVWEKLECVNPIICICEFNAVLGDTAPVAVPYQPDFYRTLAHHSNLYWGASIVALRSLAVRKGYRFVGTNSSGSNAFFVRQDFAERLDGAISDISARPSCFREARNHKGELTFISGLRRLDTIAHMPVVNTETGQHISIGSLKRPYSEEWLRELA